MTVREHWNNYTSGLSSPQSFIDWTYLSLISSALQRRVWLAPLHKPCFANIYVILVGEPGIGKGLCIDAHTQCLRHWNKEDCKLNTDNLSKDDKLIAETIAEADLKKAIENEEQGKFKGGDLIKPSLFPIAADAITYEALVTAVAQSYSRVSFYGFNEKVQKNMILTRGHASLAFSLQELSSLLRKHSGDTVRLLLGLYDCPEFYYYETKTKGKDRIKNGCLNILAGTTPTFMKSTFDINLVDEGLTSRVFYIYAKKNRKHQFTIPPLTDEQKESQKEVLKHILKLSSLYGQVETDKETEEFLQQWWVNEQDHPEDRLNRSPLMIPWYSRMNIHVKKVALALHFGESSELFITKDTFKQAIEILQTEVRNMHLAIAANDDTPEAKIATEILKLLKQGEQNWVDIYMATYKKGDKKQIEHAIDYLLETNQITFRTETDNITREEIRVWRLKEK